MSVPNGFAGMWDPRCPCCGGYMHTGHTADCPVMVARKREIQRLLEMMRKARAGGGTDG